MSYASEVLADSPFIYLHLNETSGTNAADNSGNGRNATYTGTVTLNQAGRVHDSGAAAVKLNGSTGYVSCPSTGVPTGNAVWTQEVVVRLDATGATGVLISWGAANTLQEPNLYVDSAGNLIMSTWNTDTTVQALSTGVWYHLASTWDGTTHTAYVNGVSKVTSTPGTIATPASPAFTIGRNAGSNQYYASITVQEAAGYATCLSAARILAHYNAMVAVQGAATLLADGNLTALSANAKKGAASLTADLNLSASGLKLLLGAVSLAADGNLSAQAVLSLGAQAALAAQANLSAAAIYSAVGAVLLQAQANLTANGTIDNPLYTNPTATILLQAALAVVTAWTSGLSATISLQDEPEGTIQ